eukprot:gene8560-biopygen3371
MVGHEVTRGGLRNYPRWNVELPTGMALALLTPFLATHAVPGALVFGGVLLPFLCVAEFHGVTRYDTARRCTNLFTPFVSVLITLGTYRQFETNFNPQRRPRVT